MGAAGIRGPGRPLHTLLVQELRMSPDLTALIDSGQFVCLLSWPGYGVSTDGRVWSCWTRGGGKPAILTTSWREMKRSIGKDGYARVNLKRGSGAEVVRIHHLVLEAFVGPCPPGMVGCHRDHDPMNPRLDNVRWDTQKGNMGDSVADDRMSRGEDRYNAKLTSAQVAEIRALDLGKTTQREVAIRFGVTRQTISIIRLGKKRRRG